MKTCVTFYVIGIYKNLTQEKEESVMFGPLSDAKARRRERFFKRLMAVFVIIAFSLFDAVRYAPQGYAGPVVTVTGSVAVSRSIPKELGRVEESFRGSTDKTVVFIQDAHDSLEAQENIAKIIDRMVEKEGIRTVFEEGYEGPVPTDKFFGFIKDPKIKQKVSYFLLDKLRVGGAEYAHINREHDFSLMGVEDLKRYGENIKCYQDSSRNRGAVEEDLEALLGRIATLANQYFPKDLKTWLKQKEFFSEGKLPMLNYLKGLQEFYLKSPEDRPARPFADEYPAISMLLWAQTAQDPEVIKQLNVLDSRVVFEEILQLEKDSSSAFLQNKRDREIFQYDQELKLVRRLNRIEMSQAEYEAVKETLRDFHTQKLADFIAVQTRKPLVLSKEWERHIKDAVRFYEVAQKREESIDSRLSEFLKNKKENTAILVFGGFHANGIKEILKQYGFSYIVVSPKITAIDKRHQDYYKRLMSEGLHAFEMPFLAARANKPPSIFFSAVVVSEEASARSELRAIASSVEALGDNSDPQLIEHHLASLNQDQKGRSFNGATETPKIRSEIRQEGEVLNGKKFASEYKIARNALGILKKNTNIPSNRAKQEGIVKAFISLLNHDPETFAEFMTNSLEDDTGSTETFLTEVLRRHAQLDGPGDDVPLDFKELRPKSLPVHILSGSPQKQKILKDMFRKVAMPENKELGNGVAGDEPDPKTGSPASRVQAVSIWKTMKGYFDSLEHGNTSHEDALWVGGDTLLFAGDEKLGKPGEDPGAVIRAHQKLAGKTVDAFSAATLIKVRNGNLRVQLITDRAKITFRALEEEIPAKDLEALDGNSGKSVTVGEYWSGYREANAEKLKKAAAGLMIQDEASFPFIERVVGDPRVVMGFPARLAAHQLRLDGLDVNILTNDDTWNHENAGRKIHSFSAYWGGKFREAKVKNDVVVEFFKLIRKWPQMAAQQLWELREFERGWDAQEGDSLYMRVLSHYLAKEQKEAEIVLQIMVQLQQRSGHVPLGFKCDEKRIDFITENSDKVKALRTLIGNGNKKAAVEANHVNPRNESSFQKNLKTKLLADRDAGSIPAEDRKGAVMALAFEKMWDQLIGANADSSKFAMATETQMFLYDERSSMTKALDEGQQEGALVKAIGGQAVEASSVVLLANQETGEVRFGFGMAFLEMHKDEHELDDAEKALFLRVLDSAAYQEDPVLNEIKERIHYRSRSHPVTVRDVRYFFERTSQGLKRKDGKLLLVQDPLFFVTVERVLGEPTAAIAFPWQDTIDLLTQFKTGLSYPKSKKERQERSQKAIRLLLDQPVLSSKIKEIPSRQLEDAKKKMDVYGSIRGKYLKRLASARSYSPTHEITNLEDDFNRRSIDALLNASRLSLQMVQFKRAVEYIHDIYRAYIQEENASGGSPGPSDSFIKKVYRYLDAEIEVATGEEAERLKKEKEYWQAFETSVRYIYEKYPLNNDTLERLRRYEKLEFLKLLGDGTEPFGSPVWDFNVAPLGEQTGLFRSLNDVANMWNHWDPEEPIDPERQVDLDAVASEKTSVFEEALQNCFRKDPVAQGFYRSGKDQYAGDKIWRMHSGLKKMIEKSDIFSKIYKVEFAQVLTVLKEMEDWENQRKDWGFDKKSGQWRHKNGATSGYETWKKQYDEKHEEFFRVMDSEVGAKYRDLLESMVASDFEEDFPFRNMTLLQRQKFISDQGQEMMHAMWDALVINNAAQRPTTVSVYFNNAGAESWWNLYQVFILLKLGFQVTIVVPEAPVLNKDVTKQDILFMIPYMDQYLKRFYGESLGNVLAKGLQGDTPALIIKAVRIDERPVPDVEKQEALKKGLRREKPVHGKPLSYPARVKRDLERAGKDFWGAQDALRRNLVGLISGSNFNILVGELWYGYFVGMGELSTAPINSAPKKGAGSEGKEGFFLGAARDLEHDTAFAFGWDSVAKSIQGESEGHVLTVHVHKNVRQQVDAFSEADTDGREAGGLPDTTLTYANFDLHYFYPKSWRTVDERFYYRGNLDIRKLLEDPELRDGLLKTFGDAGKFFFSSQEDRMDFVVHEATEEARREEETLFKTDADGKTVKAGKNIKMAYDFVYRTPTRGLRIRISMYEGAQEFPIIRGGKETQILAHGQIDVQFGLNFEHHLRREKSSEESRQDSVLTTRYQELSALQSKIPALFRGHVRNSARAYLAKEKSKQPYISTDFEIINPRADYVLEEKTISSQDEILQKGERARIIPVDHDTEAVKLRIRLDPKKDPSMAKFFSGAFLERFRGGSGSSNPRPLGPLAVHLVKFLDKKNGMGRLYQYVPAWIEEKDGASFLILSVPNLSEKLEVLDIFELPTEGDDIYRSTMSEDPPRLFVFRPGDGVVSDPANPQGVLKDWRTPSKKSPSLEMGAAIKNKDFWYARVVNGQKPESEREEPNKVMDLPGVIVAPVDLRSHADERLMIQNLLERSAADDAKRPALIYSDLVRIGSLYDDPKDTLWWEYHDFMTGFHRLDVSDREQYSIVQLAGPHDVILGNKVFEIAATPETTEMPGDTREEKEQKRKKMDDLRKAKIARAYKVAAYLAVKNGAKGLNINMGSSSLNAQYSEGKSISGGSGLINQPDLAASIIVHARRGAQEALGISDEEAKLYPISVKTRLAEEQPEAKKEKQFASDKTMKFMRAVIGAGASWITIHTRLQTQDYGVSASPQRSFFMETAKKLQEEERHSSGQFKVPPMFVNGDISSKDHLKLVQEIANKEGVRLAGVMIGRQISSQKDFDFLRMALKNFPQRGLPPGEVTIGNVVPLTSQQGVDIAKDHLRFMAERLGISFLWEPRILPQMLNLLNSLLGKNGRNIIPEQERGFVEDIKGLKYKEAKEVIPVLKKYAGSSKARIVRARSEARSSPREGRSETRDALIASALQALYEYRLADALEVLARGREQLKENSEALERLLFDFPPGQYSATKGWNASHVDLEEQTALFRGIEHVLNQLAGWPDRKEAFDFEGDEEMPPVLFWEGDPHASQKRQLFQAGSVYLETILETLFPRGMIASPAGWSRTLEALLPFILNSNRVDDLSRAPKVQRIDVNYLTDHRARFRALLDSEGSKNVAILLDNLGGETFGLLLAAWIMIRMGKTVTIYAKREPMLLSDTTGSDLQYSVLKFDQLMRIKFGDRLGSGLSDDIKSGKLHLKKFPWDYLYHGAQADGHKIVSVDFDFLSAFDAAVIMGELQYGDFMRGLLRRVHGTSAEALGQNNAFLNPFSKTALVFLKANKNAREINVGIEAPGYSPGSPTHGEFVVQVLFPFSDVNRSETRKRVYLREEILQRLDHVEKIMMSEEVPGGIKDTIQQIKSDRIFQEGGVVYIPSSPGAKLLVIGDLHGDLASYRAILRQHDTLEKIKSGKLYVVFLGDYVIGGLKSVETIMEVIDLKVKYPEKVILIGGNHDERRSPEENLADREQNKKRHEKTGFPSISFYDAVHDQYDGVVYDAFIRFFETLPSLAITGNRIVLAHAAPPGVKIRSLRDIVGNARLHHQMRIARAIEKIPEGYQHEFLQWPQSLIVDNERFDRFMETIGGRVFIRGHVHIFSAGNPIFNKRLETIISVGGNSPTTGAYKRDYRHTYGTYSLDTVYETMPPEAIHYIDPDILGTVFKEMGNPSRSEMREGQPQPGMPGDVQKAEKLRFFADRTAVVIIDVQKDFFASQPGFALFDRQTSLNRDDLTPMQEMINKRLRPLIDFARRQGMYVVFIQSHYPENKFIADGFRFLATPGTIGAEFFQIFPLIARNGREPVFHKSEHDSLTDPQLRMFLEQKGIQDLLITGYSTDRCVGQTALSPHAPQIRRLVIEDGVTTAGYKLETTHREWLSKLRKESNVKVVNSDEIFEADIIPSADPSFGSREILVPSETQIIQGSSNRSEPPLDEKGRIRPDSLNRAEMRGLTLVEKESEITDQHIQQMEEYFEGMAVPTRTIGRVVRALEFLSEEQFSSSEFKEFYENAEHGIEHSLQVTKKVFEWANQFHFEVDREALAVGAFLHDIKGLNSTGHEQRKNHHEEGAKVAESILRSVGWTNERIGKVKGVIRGHRGIPETYNAENYPDGYANDGQGKPKPDSLEAKLVHDADTYIEMENLARLKSITMDIRLRKNPLNILRRSVSQSFVVRMIRFAQYALFGIFRKLYRKYERFFDEHKWSRFVELCSLTDRFYDSDFYYGAGQEVNKRLGVILSREKRIWAAHTDVLEFLLGKLLEDCDPDYYFMPEIRGLVFERAPDFFRELVELTVLEVRKLGEDPDKVLSVIGDVIAKMGNASVSGDQQVRWIALNRFHLQAFRNARSVFRSEMRSGIEASTVYASRPAKIPQREPVKVPMPEKVPAPKPKPETKPLPKKDSASQLQPAKRELGLTGVGPAELRHAVSRTELLNVRADRMVGSVRTNARPATVFVDAEDFLSFSAAQKREYLFVLLSNKAVRMVVYNARSEIRDNLLGALLKLEHVTTTHKDLSGAQASFDRPGAPGIHLSKRILPSQELVQRLRKRISFFKAQGQNGGTLAAALLWAWSGGEESRLREISRGRDGFWTVAETLVRALQRSYENNLALAIAA